MKRLVLFVSAVVMTTTVAPMQAQERKSSWKIFKATAKVAFGLFWVVHEGKRIALGIIVDKEASIDAVNAQRQIDLNEIERRRSERAENEQQPRVDQDDAIGQMFLRIYQSGTDFDTQVQLVNHRADRRIRKINDIGSIGISNIFWTALGSALIYSGYKDLTDDEKQTEK